MWVKTILVHELSSAIIIDSCNAFHVQSSPPASTCSFQLPFVYIFTSSSYICTRISVKWQGYLVDTENLLTYYRLTSNCDELFTRIVFHQYWMKCLNVSRRDRPIPSVLKQRNLATGNTEFSGFCLPVIFISLPLLISLQPRWLHIKQNSILTFPTTALLILVKEKTFLALYFTLLRLHSISVYGPEPEKIDIRH